MLSLWLKANTPYWGMGLEVQLRSNALDHEKRPFSVLTNKAVGPDMKTTSGVPTNILWQEGPGEDADAAALLRDEVEWLNGTDAVANCFMAQSARMIVPVSARNLTWETAATGS